MEGNTSVSETTSWKKVCEDVQKLCTTWESEELSSIKLDNLEADAKRSLSFLIQEKWNFICQTLREKIDIVELESKVQKENVSETLLLTLQQLSVSIGDVIKAFRNACKSLELESESLLLNIPLSPSKNSEFYNIFVISESSLGFKEWDNFIFFQEQRVENNGNVPFKIYSTKYTHVQFIVLLIDFGRKDEIDIQMEIEKILLPFYGKGENRFLLCFSESNEDISVPKYIELEGKTITNGLDIIRAAIKRNNINSSLVKVSSEKQILFQWKFTNSTSSIFYNKDKNAIESISPVILSFVEEVTRISAKEYSISETISGSLIKILPALSNSTLAGSNLYFKFASIVLIGNLEMHLDFQDMLRNVGINIIEVTASHDYKELLSMNQDSIRCQFQDLLFDKMSPQQAEGVHKFASKYSYSPALISLLQTVKSKSTSEIEENLYSKGDKRSMLFLYSTRETEWGKFWEMLARFPISHGIHAKELNNSTDFKQINSFFKGNEWALHIWACGPPSSDEEFILANSDDTPFSLIEESLSSTPTLKLIFLSFSNSHKLAHRLYDSEKFSVVVYFEGKLEQVDLIKISYVFYRLLFEQNTSVLQAIEVAQSLIPSNSKQDQSKIMILGNGNFRISDFEEETPDLTELTIIDPRLLLDSDNNVKVRLNEMQYSTETMIDISVGSKLSSVAGLPTFIGINLISIQTLSGWNEIDYAKIGSYPSNPSKGDAFIAALLSLPNRKTLGNLIDVLSKIHGSGQVVTEVKKRFRLSEQ